MVLELELELELVIVLDMESKIVESDFRWTLDASIIGSNPGVTKD